MAAAVWQPVSPQLGGPSGVPHILGAFLAAHRPIWRIKKHVHSDDTVSHLDVPRFGCFRPRHSPPECGWGAELTLLAHVRLSLGLAARPMELPRVWDTGQRRGACYTLARHDVLALKALCAQQLSMI